MTLAIVLFLLGDYLLHLTAEFLNLGRLPAASKATAYQKEGSHFDLLHRGTGLAMFFLFWTLGGFAAVQSFSILLTSHPLLQGLTFAGALAFLKFLFDLPFSAYSTFWIEERYGFNRTTKDVFIADQLKGLLLGGSLGGVAFGLLVGFFEKFGPNGWWLAWIFLSAFQIFVLFIAPVVILPLFNRFEPLKDEALLQAISAYFERIHFSVQKIFLMDGSRRSSKANAFFTGLGKFRKLVLFDTLTQKHPTEELLAILAHEVGHYRLGHIPKMILISILSSGLLLFGSSFFIGSDTLCRTFGLPETTIAATLLFIGLLYLPATRLLSILTHALYRRHEFAADEFSWKTFPHPGALERALLRLHEDHLSHPDPHPLTVLLEYTHPPLKKRRERLQQWATRESPSGP